MNLGPAQTGITVAEVARREGVDISGGVSVILNPLCQSSDSQRQGWHWLLGEWLKLDPVVAKNMEALKTRLLIIKFGAINVSDKHGNESLIAARRTTQFWSWETVPPGYVRQQLSKELYTELVEFTYQMAAQDNIVLPDMLKKYEREFLEDYGFTFKRGE